MNTAQEFLARFGYEVATHLSAIGQMRLWNVGKVSDTSIRLVGPDGMEITLWAGSVDPGDLASVRFEVTGEYPPDTSVMREDAPRINVSAKKGTRAIARDIERRFLSEYVPLYYEKLELQQAIERRREARERVMADLAEWFGFKEVRDKDNYLRKLERGRVYNERTGRFEDSFRGEINASLRIAPESRYQPFDPETSKRQWEVDLKLEGLTMDQALRIAEALKEPAFPAEQLSLL